MGHLGFNQTPMAEAEGGFSRDLLQRFISSGNNHFIRKYEDQEEEEVVELSLGLSLNGRFGVDPSANKKLIRSSSIPEFMTPVKKEEEELVCLEEQKVMMMMGTPLSRTCSLPVETEEQWRKRKELQSLRRMEAKRKRDEKQRNFRATRNRVSLEENCEEEKRIGDNGAMPIDGKSRCMKVLNDFSLSVMPPVVVPNWGKERGFGGCGVEFNGEKSKSLVVGGVQGLPPLPPPSPPPPPAAPSSQGSIGSQGSGTSGISESESLPVQGPNKTTQARTLTNISSNPDQSDQKPGIEMSKMYAGDTLEDPSKNLTGPDKGNGEILRNMLLDMPCVSTKGGGPDGKRIEGFLYQYKKGEEVRIVCVCHGSFLSPAEFVKHAGGGGDVEHPLKHIVVNSPSFL